MIATRSSLISDLQHVGLRAGDLVMVHSSLRSIGHVIGGATVLVQSLLEVLGPEGTLAAYVDFEPFFEDDDPEIPVFDKRLFPAALDHGILHETIRTWPGSVRSDHPDAGVAAIGARAAWLTADHPLQYGYGDGTPFARIVEANGRILMIGAPLDTITMLHYAEYLANIPDKRIRRYRRLMPGPQWVDIEEFDTEEPVHDALPPNCFEQIAEDFLASGQGRRGLVGQAPTYLFESPDLVRFGVQWLEREVGRQTFSM